MNAPGWNFPESIHKGGETMTVDHLLVVKLGGGEGLDVELACADLAAIARNRPLVVIHGVSAVMAELSSSRNMPVEMLTSPSGHSYRYTNSDIRDLYVEAAKLVNREITEYLTEYGVNTIGLADDIVIHGQRKQAVRAICNGRTRIIRDDYSGTITRTDFAPLMGWLEAGYVPVLPPLAMSDDGLLNIDGDRAGASVAAALRAEELVILSNVPGLFRNYPDTSSLIRDVPVHQLNAAMQWAQGRMKRKVLGAQEAITGGARRVIIGDGRIANPVTQALQGQGTVFSSC
jgi:[amino group carrier protein]-L-2-aminoadipate 6-kinase